MKLVVKDARATVRAWGFIMAIEASMMKSRISSGIKSHGDVSKSVFEGSEKNKRIRDMLMDRTSLTKCFQVNVTLFTLIRRLFEHRYNHTLTALLSSTRMHCPHDQGALDWTSPLLHAAGLYVSRPSII